MRDTVLFRDLPRVPPPELAEVRRAVQGWLDEEGEPTYVEALRACSALREMVRSFARMAKVLVLVRNHPRRREVVIRADQALRQAQVQDRPGLSASSLSRLLARTLLEMMDLCEALRDSK